VVSSTGAKRTNRRINRSVVRLFCVRGAKVIPCDAGREDRRGRGSQRRNLPIDFGRGRSRKPFVNAKWAALRVNSGYGRLAAVIVRATR
jgi:hypothetical protein